MVDVGRSRIAIGAACYQEMAGFAGDGENTNTRGLRVHVLKSGIVAEVGDSNQQAVGEEKISADVLIEPDGGIGGEMLDSAGGSAADEIGENLSEEGITQADLGIGQG